MFEVLLRSRTMAVSWYSPRALIVSLSTPRPRRAHPESSLRSFLRASTTGGAASRRATAPINHVKDTTRYDTADREPARSIAGGQNRTLTKKKLKIKIDKPKIGEVSPVGTKTQSTLQITAAAFDSDAFTIRRSVLSQFLRYETTRLENLDVQSKTDKYSASV